MQNVEQITIFPTPIANSNRTSGYVYVARVRFDLSHLHKIGFSKNLKTRMKTLRGHGYEPELAAYGYSENARNVESEILSELHQYCHSFVFDDNYPKWSNEFFDLGWPQMLRVIEMLEEYCKEPLLTF